MDIQTIQLQYHDSYISHHQIKSSCIVPNQKWKLDAQPGQAINISIINIDEPSHDTIGDVYGTVQNPSTESEIIFGAGPKENNLMVSSGAVIITLQQEAFNDAHFLLHIVGRCRCFIYFIFYVFNFYNVL